MATKSPSAMSPVSIPPLLRVPAELHLDIVSEFQESDEEGALATLYFRLSNRYFYNLIDKLTHDTLLFIEKTPWAVGRTLYTCKFCVRLRCAATFAEAMLKGKTGINGGFRYKRFATSVSAPTAVLRLSKARLGIQLALRRQWMARDGFGAYIAGR
jgi:hypothetical protein